MDYIRTVSAVLLIGLSLTVAQDIIVKPIGEKHTRPLGENIIFTCEGSSIPPEVDPDLKWYNTESQQITDWTGRVYIEEDGPQVLKLYITNIKTEDSGVYSCRGRPEGNDIEKRVELALYKDITFDHAPSPQHPAINTDAQIECRVSGNPTPEVSWRYRGQKLQSNGGRYLYNSLGLKIMNITKVDDGEYSCRAEVSAAGRYKEAKIDVIAHTPPTMLQEIGEKEGTEDQDFYISCRASGDPAPKYEFFKGNSQAPMNSYAHVQVDADGGAVHFKPLKKSDEDSYKCKASNDVGFAEGSGNLRVIVPAHIIELQNQTAKEGESQKLLCKSKGDPDPMMTWKKISVDGSEIIEYVEGENDGGRIMVRKVQTGWLELEITLLQPSDSSNYTCKASNTGGTFEKNGTIIVQFAPRFSPNHPTMVYNWEGKTRNMTCQSMGEPEPEIKWYKDNIELLNNETFRIYHMGRNSNLQITVRSGDAGWIYNNYQCKAKNAHGEESTFIKLEPATVPGTPKSVSVKDSSPTMVILTVVPPDEDGGVPIDGYRVGYENHLQDFKLHEEILFENLKSGTTYIFSVRAKNEVGAGNPRDFTHTTSKTRKPYPIQILSDPEGIYPYTYVVRWENPRTGGMPIKEYRIKYRKVKVKDGSFSIDRPLEAWNKREIPDDLNAPMVHYELEGLFPSTHYQVEIVAKNDMGTSLPNTDFVFLTNDDPGYRPVVGAGASKHTATFAFILTGILAVFMRNML